MSREDHMYLHNAKDRVAFTVFILGAPIDLMYEFYFVSDHYRRGQGDASIHYYYYGFLVFCAVQVYWNLFYVTTCDNRVTTATIDTTIHCSTLDKCDKCNVPRIPQSHHCKICDVCVLRRDHHCWFAGNCVGLRNQGNFIILTLYLWLAAVVQNIYNLPFVCDVLGCSVSSLITICVPQFPVLIKEFSLYSLFINFMTFLGLLLLVLFTYLFYTQICQLITGLTNYERTKHITKRESSTSIYSHLVSALGHFWFLTWLLPPLASPRFHGDTKKQS